MFDQYVSILSEKYPYLLVDGANYDPPGINMLLARVLVSVLLSFEKFPICCHLYYFCFTIYIFLKCNVIDTVLV